MSFNIKHNFALGQERLILRVQNFIKNVLAVANNQVNFFFVKSSWQNSLFCVEQLRGAFIDLRKDFIQIFQCETVSCLGQDAFEVIEFFLGRAFIQC